METYPTTILDLDTWSSSPRIPGIQALSHRLSGGLAVDLNVAIRSHAEGMIVFLPGAQGSKSPRRVPFYHRWSWHEDLPEMHVVALSDPSIALNESILGGWFMHPELDLVAELAGIVGHIAALLDIAPENIVFHGSSLGGFGAIGMAAHLHGAAAISEIPQIDVERWPVPSSMRRLAELVGQPLSDFRRAYPERVDVLDRVRFAGVVPPFTLVTNTTDMSYDDQVGFMQDVSMLGEACDVIGEQRLVVTELATGHKPLPKDAVLELLRSTVDGSR